MAYDSKTNTFSPEGRLYQVEYAVESVGKAPTALGIVTSEGVIFATERRQRSALLDVERPELRNYSGEKVYRVDKHIAVAVAGMTADANHLVEVARQIAQRHTYTFQEPLPAEDLCQRLCDEKQSVTMAGGLRPYGIAFLIAAWDRNFGFQLYQTDPSGNYYAWKAFAIGQNDGTAQSMLKNDWKEKMTAKEGILLALEGPRQDHGHAHAEPGAPRGGHPRQAARAGPDLHDPHGHGAEAVRARGRVDAQEGGRGEGGPAQGPHGQGLGHTREGV
jgi:20S proteasome subunit alpha 3